MALKLTPIKFSDLDSYQDKHVLAEYFNGWVACYTYGEPDPRDENSYWFFDDGISLDVLDDSCEGDIKSLYIVEVA
ncbi:hypothetical protein V8P91_17270 [Acinetobacter baumannii]